MDGQSYEERTKEGCVLFPISFHLITIKSTKMHEQEESELACPATACHTIINQLVGVYLFVNRNGEESSGPKEEILGTIPLLWSSTRPLWSGTSSQLLAHLFPLGFSWLYKTSYGCAVSLA